LAKKKGGSRRSLPNFGIALRGEKGKTGKRKAKTCTRVFGTAIGKKKKLALLNGNFRWKSPLW